MHQRRLAAARRRTTVIAVAVMLVATAIGAADPAVRTVRAADVAAGYDVTWTVTRPNGSVRTDDAIAVGDDLSLEYAAVDGTPVTACRIRLTAFGGGFMESPGVIEDDICRLSTRLPDFPNPEERTQFDAEPDAINLDLCVYTASISFADAATRTMSTEDQTMPGGRACNNWSDYSDHNELDFRVDGSGSRRPFQSDPFIVSWDPVDWGTGMEPLRFGRPWHAELPAGIDRCWFGLNGSSTALFPRQESTCVPWDLRLPGVLPSTLPWDGGPGAWTGQIEIDYTVSDPGPSSFTVSSMSVPVDASDGIFESSLASIFPTDLATARFVTEGMRWRPSFQVGGEAATSCTMTFITRPATFPVDPLTYEVFEAPTDADNVCTFDLPSMDVWEDHQYWVQPHLVGGNDENTKYNAQVLGIPAPEPPVIDPPVEEGDGETGLGVEPGEGQGLAVDVEVVAAGSMVRLGSERLERAVCHDQVLSTNLDQGGEIPRLETSCGLSPGSYVAVARMVDAAGAISTSQRSFTVLPPRPHIAGKSPTQGAVAVPRNIKPTVVFDVPVTGVSKSSFRLRDTVTGDLVTAAVSYNSATRRATLQPTGLLRAGRTYRVYLHAAIKNAANGRTLAPLDWAFKVTTDATKPTIVGRSPGSGSTGVPRSATAAVRFSESVKNVSSSTVQLRDTVTKAYVGATVVYDAALRRVTLDPIAALLPRRTYQVIVRSTIIDLGGNPLTTMTWSFTTGS